MVVRPETPEDESAVGEVVAAAFGSRTEVELLEGLRRDSAWRRLSFVAECHGAVVGHVAFTRGWVDAPARLEEVLVLSPLSVQPARQGGGVGTALVNGALHRLRERPEPAVFLEGSPRYYPRFGFVPGAEHSFTPPSVRIPDRAFQVLLLPSYTPEVRGALVYPDVFWRHDAVGLRPDAGDAPAGR